MVDPQKTRAWRLFRRGVTKQARYSRRLMPLKAAVRFRLRDGSAHEKALPKPAGGEVKMEDVATEIALLAQQVVRHADNPWIQSTAAIGSRPSTSSRSRRSTSHLRLALRAIAGDVAGLELITGHPLVQEVMPDLAAREDDLEAVLGVGTR